MSVYRTIGPLVICNHKNGIFINDKLINCIQYLTSQFPQNGELVLRRLVIQFRRGFKRNDKSICLSTTRFIAHLVNQQVVSCDGQQGFF